MEPTEDSFYTTYRVDLEFQQPIAAGRPATPALAVKHATQFAAGVTNALKLSKKDEGDVSEEAVEQYIMHLSSIFPIDEEGIYVTGNQLTALLKDAAQSLKLTVKHKGLNRTLRDGGVIFPIRVYLGVEPTFVERPVKPDNGPANIKRFQIAESVALSIPVAVLNNGDLNEQMFRQIWRQAQSVGLGANKHLDYGKFIVSDLREDSGWEMEDLLRGDVGAEMLNGHEEMTNGARPKRVNSGRKDKAAA